MPVTISAIMPVYNGAATVAKALDSALSQTQPPEEIVVVDDGSTDATAEIVARFGPPVRCVRQANAGPAAARNRGIAEARGQWVAFLDSDDLWYPTKLQRQRELIAAAPDLGVVFCNWDKRRQDGEILCEGFSDPAERLSARSLRLRIVGERLCVIDQEMLPVLLDTYILHTNTLAVRRDLLAHIRYDVRYNWGEDWLLCMDLARVAKFGFVDEVLAEYRERAGSLCKRPNLWSMLSRYEVSKAPLTRYAEPLPRDQRRTLYRWVRQWGSTYGYRLLDEKGDPAAARHVWREAADLRPGMPDPALRLLSMTPGWLLRALRHAKRGQRR